MDDLALAATSPANSPRGIALAAWLRALERTGHGWDALFAALQPHVDRVAHEFADVVSVDEARCECMSLTYERYVGDWLDRVASSGHDAPFARFVVDRLRDHFRAARRRRVRRAALDRTLVDGASSHTHGNVVDLERDGAAPLAAALTGEVPATDCATGLREAMERLEARPEFDAFTRDVLWMLAHGHPQKEIARLTGASEPTVSRAVARLRAAFDAILRS